MKISPFFIYPLMIACAISKSDAQVAFQKESPLTSVRLRSLINFGIHVLMR